MKKMNPMRMVVAVAAICLLSAGSASSQVLVVATAGNPGPTPYVNVAAAFAAINAGTHQGIIGVGITGNTTETGPCVLNASGAGPAIYTAVTISPTVDGVTISGPTTSGRGLIELNGADNVTIDGDNPNSIGINRNLTITNTAANTITYASVIRIALSTVNSTADNNIVRNCVINGNATGRNTAGVTSTVGSEHTTYGILVGGGASTVDNVTAPGAITSIATTVAAPITALNFLANNNAIDACARGIAVMGSSNTVATGLAITGNTIGNATPSNATTVYSRGITIQGFSSATVSGNTLQNLGFFVSTATGGIWVGENSPNTTGAVVEKNVVLNVINSAPGTFGAYGISLSGGTNHVVRNNFVTGINHVMTGGAAFSTTFGIHGIRVASGTGHTVVYNTVNMYGSRLGTPATNLLSSAFTITSTIITGCTVQNNIFSNTMTGGTTSIAAVSMYLPTGVTSALNLTLNNNFYYDGTTAGQSGILQVGATYNLVNLYTSANFVQNATAPATNSRSYTSLASVAGTNDNASWASSVAAPFVSNSNLHVNLAAPNVTDLDLRALVIGGVTTDIDNDVRNAATPDIGADEFSLAVCAGAVGGTALPATATRCAGQTIGLSATGQTTGTGVTYQWQVATVSGGPYANVPGAITPNYTTAALSAGTYYYVLQVTCSTGPVVAISTEAVVTVNALPVIVVSPTSATFCSGGNPVALTAGGGVTYAWGPATGLSATIGVTVNASPTVTTTYSVVGMDAAGCTSSATTTITNAPGVSLALSSSAGTVCAGDDDTLVATVSSVLNYCQPTYSTGTGFGDYVSSVVVNTLNNATGASATPYYTLYPATGNTTTTLVAGSTYTITLVAGTYTSNDLAAWVDYNQNGVLNDPGEKLGETDNLGASPASTSFIFTVPLNAINGSVRLRVRDIDHGGTNDMDPCAAQSAFGETEDYVVTIIGGLSNALTYAWTPSTFLNTTTNDTVIASAITSTTMYVVTATSASGCSDVDSIQVVVNALPTVAASANDSTICAGDAVVLTGSGATTYDWMPVATSGATITDSPLTSTTYTVTGTDVNGCSNTGTLAITVNPLPVVTLSGNGTICNGDTALLTGSSGGTSQWYLNGAPIVGANSNTYAATLPGVYNMTKTNINGCSDSSSTGITVVVNANPIVAIGNDTTFCDGGMTTLMAPSGAYSYLWSDNSTSGSLMVMMSGSYSVLVTDNATGCSASDTAVVTVNANPVVNLGADTSLCSVSWLLDAQNAGATYMWSDMSTAQTLSVGASGTYYVDVIDGNGCASSDTVVLVLNTPPTVTYTASIDTVCQSTTAPFALTGETPAGGIYSGPGVAAGIFDAMAANLGMNVITYTYTDSVTGCSYSAMDSIFVDVCTDASGIFANSSEVNVFPNPNSGSFTVTIENADYTELAIELVSLDGKTVYSNMMTNVSGQIVTQIDMSQMANGTYFLRLSSNDSILIVKKVVRAE